ncbi:hypothetical protein HMPREF0202_01546 [Cetobacterium somerae ATCC BAA-474]|uniref:Uncharacterized protein n=1 Tax=Cetobacterium somerae ATCC BAA-474 TaxID=1319815 RepID=U7VCM9_9FUSO|nr:hypothetical protein HMPREF0202_01546 [Cetobacterium somerae ATCC BAA-474]
MPILTNIKFAAIFQRGSPIEIPKYKIYILDGKFFFRKKL